MIPIHICLGISLLYHYSSTWHTGCDSVYIITRQSLGNPHRATDIIGREDL